MDRAEEFAAKQARVDDLLERGGYGALLLRSRANIAWLGCGPPDGAALDHVQGSRSEIWHQAETGVMAFVAARGRVGLITENIELPRLTRDEFGGLPIQVLAQPWHESDLAAGLAEFLAGGGATVATDIAEPALVEACAGRGIGLVERRAEIATLRAELLPRELERYRWLGRTAATILGEVCRAVRPGVAEAEVVADAHARLHRLGIAQEVDIVCSDERLWQDRHGLYSDRRIERMAMVVFCAQKWGLVANATRMVHLGPAPADLIERHRALSRFDRQIMEATRPGTPLRSIFVETIERGYAALGEPDAWRDHHQGGSTGYTGRDQRVTPTTEGTVQLHQAFAWNPSLPAVKSEDTFVVQPDGPEILTVDPDWPVYEDSGRPAMLEIR